jgi:hypothetical protein
MPGRSLSPQPSLRACRRAERGVLRDPARRPVAARVVADGRARRRDFTGLRAARGSRPWVGRCEGPCPASSPLWSLSTSHRSDNRFTRAAGSQATPLRPQPLGVFCISQSQIDLGLVAHGDPPALRSGTLRASLVRFRCAGSGIGLECSIGYSLPGTAGAPTRSRCCSECNSQSYIDLPPGSSGRACGAGLASVQGRQVAEHTRRSSPPSE